MGAYTSESCPDLYAICVNMGNRCYSGRFVKFKPFLNYERFYQQDYESFADQQVVAHDRFVACYGKNEPQHHGRHFVVIACIAQ